MSTPNPTIISLSRHSHSWLCSSNPISSRLSCFNEPTASDYTYLMPTAPKSSPARRKAGQPLPRPAAPPKIAKPWSLRSSGNLRILELDAFKKLPWLLHGFSTAPGGTSNLFGQKILNLSFSDWDTHENVLENRKKFQTALGAQKFPLINLKQIHSAVVRPLAAAPKEPCKGDASLTKAPGLLLGVQTADCVPILLVDPKKRAVAAVHAGWRGSLASLKKQSANSSPTTTQIPPTSSPPSAPASAPAVTKSVPNSSFNSHPNSPMPPTTSTNLAPVRNQILFSGST